MWPWRSSVRLRSSTPLLFNLNIGVSSSGKTQHFDCCIRRFESCHPSQKSTGQNLSIFYPLRKQWYITAVRRISSREACISSAAGCISFRNDDIQNFVLMICNSCGIVDIHGFRRDLRESSKSYTKQGKISFSCSIAKKEASLLVELLFYLHNKISSHKNDCLNKKHIKLKYFTAYNIITEATAFIWNKYGFCSSSILFSIMRHNNHFRSNCIATLFFRNV